MRQEQDIEVVDDVAKVEVGSEMYKKGIRWTELLELENHPILQLEPFETNTKFVVLDYILTIFMTILQEAIIITL